MKVEFLDKRIIVPSILILFCLGAFQGVIKIIALKYGNEFLLAWKETLFLIVIFCVFLRIVKRGENYGNYFDGLCVNTYWYMYAFFRH
jgi:hypothetical protein